MMKVKCAIHLLLLLALSSCTTGSRRAEMTAVLDRAQQQNLDYDSITHVDSIALAAAFFDRHGSSNERMRAHYLLGCAYRDMGEAPAALQSFQDAADRADTLNRDCDYRRLMSVYGQMADLFHAQNLPTDELEAFSHVQEFAYRQRDTLTFIRSIELKVRPYFLLYDTISMLSVLQQAQTLYNKYGFHQEASSIYPSIIDLYISQDSLETAKRLMDIFENESGLFDSEGNISKGREGYYYLKGLYYNKTQKQDSAEYYFRKLLNHGLNTDAYRGLLSVYKEKNADSTYKYAQLFEEGVNKEQDALRTQTVHQMTSLYNYQRFVKKADAESRKAARLKYYFLLSVFFLAIIVFAVVVIGINLSHKKKLQAKETERLRLDYAEAIEKKDSLIKEMDMLRENHEQLIISEQEAKNTIESVKANNCQLIREKEKEISDLTIKIREYASRLFHSTETVGDNPQFTLLIEDFHRKAQRRRNTSLPKKTEWNQFIDSFMKIYPKVSVTIGGEQLLSSQELKACILLLLDFSNSEIISLLNVSSQGMTNIKTRINEKLFDESNAVNLTQKLKNIPMV